MSEPGSKPYVISKQVFMAALKKVRSKKGAAGVDGVTVEQFAQDYKVPIVGDRIAQTVAVAYLEPLVEPVFHDDSYGCRPGRSPLDAVAKCRERCWQYAWAIELDISDFFDTLIMILCSRRSPTTPMTSGSCCMSRVG